MYSSSVALRELFYVTPNGVIRLDGVSGFQNKTKQGENQLWVVNGGNARANFIMVGDGTCMCHAQQVI